MQFPLSPKQIHAHCCLSTVEYADISEIVFGGGARGGKTYLGSFWVISRCLSLPGSQWLVAREELKTLKRTTLRTFFEVLGKLGLKRNYHYEYNAQDMIMTFANGSIVFFAELKEIPSDPEFDRLGSYDLTGAWIDEAQEVCEAAKDVLQFRFTLLEKNGWKTTPKTLYTCNPGKNWIYSQFWKPLIKEKKTIEGKMFITSLYKDNPYIDHAKYEKNAYRTKNKAKIQRLLFGNYEYDDDPTKLMDYDSIIDIFTNRPPDDGKKYLICDVARTGDRIVIGYWEGLLVRKVHVYRNLKIPETAKKLLDLAVERQVPHSQIAVDADGMGVGVLDLIPNAKGFHNGGKPVESGRAQKQPDKKTNYANLKTQCAFKLADLVNEGKIGVDEIDQQSREDLIEELDAIKQIGVDSDKKTSINSKDDVKKILGRSPDLSDMMLMRMYFEVQPPKKVFVGTF